MKGKKVIEVWYNYHYTQNGDCFGIIRVGDLIETVHGVQKCTDISISDKDGKHAIVTYEDGCVEEQWNINKIVWGE